MIVEAISDQPPEHAFERRGWLDVRQAHHPERKQQADDARDERNEQRDLERAGPRVRIDADDLVLGRLGLTGEQLLRAGCCS